MLVQASQVLGGEHHAREPFAGVETSPQYAAALQATDVWYRDFLSYVDGGATVKLVPGAATTLQDLQRRLPATSLVGQMIALMLGW